MDTRTGEIMSEEEMLKRTANKPEEEKWYKTIPEGYADQLSAMNRKDRRAWMRKNKHILRPSH